MKKILSLLLLISFILWILPLGYFIKPSQEKLACDGMRAMCMCSLGHKAPNKDMVAGINLQAAIPNKDNSSGGGNVFDSIKPVLALNLHSASIFDNQYLAYKNPFLNSIEYVTKF